MEYHLFLPVTEKEIKKLHVGDIIYLTGDIFTARDVANQKMLELNNKNIPFVPSEMALYHCGPLVVKKNKSWCVISAGPTTSDRMEPFTDKLIGRYDIKIIIGKGGMGVKTSKALEKYKCIYASYTGGAGALAAHHVEKVPAVYWFDELGMTEAVWILKVKEFGPLVVAMDSYGKSIYKKSKR